MTSLYLLESITASGISRPSMVPCCTAVKVSPQAMGTAEPPMELNMSMYTGFCITRYFTPLTSAGFCTGFLLLIMLRKPPSIAAKVMMPLVSRRLASSAPTLPSSTLWACASLAYKKGKSLSW